MARQLKWWIVAVLVACAAIAIAYLPPRAMPLVGRRFFRVAQGFQQPTPYHRRVQEVAQRYRFTSFELTMREYREVVRPELERRRSLEIPGPVVYFAGPDSLSDSARGLVRALFDTAWSQLGLGVSKISVAVILRVVFDRPPPTQTPANLPMASASLLPDSSDRATCLAYVPIIYWGRPGVLKQTHPAGTRDLADLLRNGLGTCAYFAGFGVPGHEVARWLAARDYDLALYPWRFHVSAQATGSLLDTDRTWFWSSVYRYQPGAIACMAGRRDACGRTALAGGTETSVPVVSTEQQWWKPPSLAGAGRYFADLVTDIGPERFGRFWNSELPVDTALTAAMRMPVGEWTRRWQATIVPPIRLGPAASLATSLLATVLGIVAVLLVALTASRRQVR